MKLIILAAGVGNRLSPATQNTPKSLLTIDGEKTLLDKQLEAAKYCGIKDICIITGFQTEKIEDKIKTRADLGLNISIIYNPFFKSHNNLVSLWTSTCFMDENFIMLNGDNIFKPNVLANLINKAKELENGLLVAINKKSIYDEDDTKIILNKENQIVKISKEIDYNNISAEWIGICAVCGNFIKEFVDKINDLVRTPELLEGSPHYLSVFQGLIEDGKILKTIEIEPNTWGEIDFLTDLEYVRQYITRFNI
ncbi:MAG: phosphocholine cytidylyltransferase family protein [Arcobacteraceae bacterium]|nr:phosphocholine cytidylyltransferase family protein [Arcobacteraceae bacterium]MDY0327532.1 phosphocholine cytidylyltransferase family protein [Arcobacteraceae bacterium]